MRRLMFLAAVLALGRLLLRGRRFQTQLAGILRAARHQRDVRAGLLPRRPPGWPQHHHARRAHRLERRRAARAVARAVVADSETRQARSQRGHAGNPRGARVSRTRSAIARASTPSSIRTSSSTTRCARGPKASPFASASISTRPSRKSGWARWVSISSSSRACCSASPTSSARRDGVFQRQPSGPGEIPTLARGKRLEVAPETELYHLTIESVRGGELELLDGRGNHNNGWFVVRALAPAGATANAIEWLVTPHAKAGWMRTPVIQVSQVGYHPAQPKQAIIELDPRDTQRDERDPAAHRPGGAGRRPSSIASRRSGADSCATSTRTLDFSDVKEPGVYVVRYGEPGQQSVPHQRRRVHARGLAADARILPAGADVPHEGAGEIPAVAWRLPSRRRAHGAGEPQPLRRLPARARRRSLTTSRASRCRI